MIKTGDKEKDYLLLLLRASLKKEEVPEPTEDINVGKLLKLAVNQQVYTTVLPYLEKTGILPPEEEKKWKTYKLNELSKNIVVNNERQAICQDMEEKGIKYMFMKGLVIREYYPQTLMRQMSDNDILYDEEKRDDLFKIMENHGFYIADIQKCSDDFFKAPYSSMEMHRKLFSETSAYCVDFDIWERAIKDEESDYKYHISPEDNYIYSLGHMYKHYCSSGCGVRFICDTYLLHYSKDNLDFDYISRKYEEFGLTEFNQKVLSLVEAVFNDKAPTEEDSKLLAEIFAGGVFGEIKSVSQTVEEKGGKFKYLMGRLFPPKSIMFATYEVLQKKPYLLPYYYIVRLVVRYKHKGDKAKKELKNVLKS